MVSGVIHGENPVIYDPPKPAKVVNPNEAELVRFDKFGMGSIIGQITNKGASAYALLPILKEKYGEDSEEYKLTLSRLKQTCKAQSAQIDKTKLGKEVKGIPECWYKKNFFEEDDDRRVLYNNILLDKRPYFFKYLYKDSKTEYNKFNDVQNYRSEDLFKKPLEELLSSSLDALTKEEQEFVEHYYEYCPLIISDSCMNLLCRYIEKIDFELKQKIRYYNNDIQYNLMKNNKVKYTDTQKKEVLKALERYNKWVQTCKLIGANEDGLNIAVLGKDYFYSVESNTDIIVNVLVDYCYEDNKGNKDIIWNVFGKEVFENIVSNTDSAIYYPFKDEHGEIEYLGQKFALKEVQTIE